MPHMDTSVIGRSRSQKLHECRYQSYSVDITVINIFQKKRREVIGDRMKIYVNNENKAVYKCWIDSENAFHNIFLLDVFTNSKLYQLFINQVLSIDKCINHEKWIDIKKKPRKNTEYMKALPCVNH